MKYSIEYATAEYHSTSVEIEVDSVLEQERCVQFLLSGTTVFCVDKGHFIAYTLVKG